MNWQLQRHHHPHFVGTLTGLARFGGPPPFSTIAIPAPSVILGASSGRSVMAIRAVHRDFGRGLENPWGANETANAP